MPSSVSTPMCLRHLFRSSRHPTCSGIITQLMCHPSRFWPQSLNLTLPENASGKPSPKCAYIHAPETGYHHPTITPKGTVWTKWCGKWWTEWEERSWFSSKTLSLGQDHRKILCPPSTVQSCPLLPPCAHVSSVLKRKHSRGCPPCKHYHSVCILSPRHPAAHVLCPEQIHSGAQTLHR